MASCTGTDQTEYVVLVDENNVPVGVADKATVHGDQTPLHRGFSVFLFNRQGQLLLQQRSRAKATWPGVWSNSCCGHPGPGESTVEAMHRRIRHELGVSPITLQVLLPGYRYRYEHDGIAENEFCPVAVGVLDQAPRPNPAEVAAISWIAWEEFLAELEGQHSYSEWSAEEARLLDAHAGFRAFRASLGDASPSR